MGVRGNERGGRKRIRRLLGRGREGKRNSGRRDWRQMKEWERGWEAQEEEEEGCEKKRKGMGVVERG